MHEPEEARRQDVLLRRLQGLGLAVKPFPDGRGVAVKLPLSSERFELPGGGSARFDSVSFATVGGDRIKCLKPVLFFHLPLIRVGSCATAAEFEARIRTAWRARLLDLVRTRNWLEKQGLTAKPATDDAPVLCVRLDVGDPEAQARLFEPGRVILPGRGPLTGVCLRRAEDRVFKPDPSLPAGLDVELAISTRLEELARLDARLQRERVVRPLDETSQRFSPALGSGRRILIVGPTLSVDAALVESLRLRGYAPMLARTEREALRSFEFSSPELVLTETELGRFEGIELIPELRTVSGVEEVPVVLVDLALNRGRRDAARRAGAAGYLVRPFEVESIAAGLANLVQSPRRRRFRRYRKQLAVMARSATRPDFVSDIGRGGMFVWTERPTEVKSVDYWSLTLPELGATFGATAEVLHARTVPGSAKHGLGLRFRAFDTDAEALLIRYLRSIEGRRP